MRDRSMQSGTELAREIQLTDWSTPGNLSNRSSGVQIPRDICTRFGRYLYSTKCSWIIITIIMYFHVVWLQSNTCRGLLCLFCSNIRKCAPFDVKITFSLMASLAPIFRCYLSFDLVVILYNPKLH